MPDSPASTGRALRAGCGLLVGALAGIWGASAHASAAVDLTMSCNVGEYCAGAGTLTPEPTGGGDLLAVECAAVAVNSGVILQTGVACTITGADSISYWAQPTTAATWATGNQVSQDIVLHNVPAQTYTVCVQGNYETLNAWEPGWTAGACSSLVL